MLDEGVVESFSQMAKIEGPIRARVTQIMNLLKLPAEMLEFIAGLKRGFLPCMIVSSGHLGLWKPQE